MRRRTIAAGEGAWGETGGSPAIDQRLPPLRSFREKGARGGNRVSHARRSGRLQATAKEAAMVRSKKLAAGEA